MYDPLREFYINEIVWNSFLKFYVRGRAEIHLFGIAHVKVLSLSINDLIYLSILGWIWITWKWLEIRCNGSRSGMSDRLHIIHGAFICSDTYSRSSRSGFVNLKKENIKHVSTVPKWNSLIKVKAGNISKDDLTRLFKTFSLKLY